MAAGKTPSPARVQWKHRGVLRLRFPVRLDDSTPPRGHAEGRERGALGGRREEAAAALPRRGSPRPTRRGGGDGGRGRQGGRAGPGELRSGSPPSPRRGGAGVDGRRREGGRGGRGGDGELSTRSAYPGGAAAAVEGGNVAVHTCHVCSKTFDRVKALYGHMRSCRGAAAAAAAEKLPALPRQEREKKQRVEKKEGEDAPLARDLARTWAVTGQRGRGGGRINPSDGAKESQQAKSARVAAPDRARVAQILREVTGRQIQEEDLDRRPWVSEMVRGAQDLMFLTTGEVVFGPVAASGHSEKSVAIVPVPLAKIPEVKIPEPSYTVCDSPIVPETEVIVIDDDDDDEPNNGAVAEINNTSSVTIAADEASLAPAQVRAAAAAVTFAKAPMTAAAAVTIATAPDAATGKEATCVNGNGGVAATGAGAGENKMFPCPRCFKVFDCFRGLGGHMTFHKNSERRAKELQDIRDVSASLAATLSSGAAAVRARASAWANARGLHVCHKCGRTFATGQSLGGHMRLHYAGPPLIGNPGRAAVWPAPAHASGLSHPGPAIAGSSPFPFSLLKEKEPLGEMTMAAAARNAAVVHGPAATGIGFSLPAATTSRFPLAFAAPKQEEEGKPPGPMAKARGNGARGRFRLFGVDIAEGPKQEPKK